MFGCCCGGSETTAGMTIQVIGMAIWGGFEPFELVDANSISPVGSLPSASYQSNKPLGETLYREKTISSVSLNAAGDTLLGYAWITQVLRIHPQMADGYYYRKTTAGGGGDASYDKNDDGSTSGSEPGWDGLGQIVTLQPGYSGPTQVSVSATELVFEYYYSGTPCVTVTVTLSDPVVVSDLYPVAETLRDVIDLTTPGADYTPSGATKYVIDGVQRILTVVPNEYQGTSNAAYYFTPNQSTDGAVYNIITKYARTGSGIAPIHTQTVVSAGDFVIQVGGVQIATFANAFEATISDVFATPIRNRGRLNNGGSSNPRRVLRSKAKFLTDGTAHRWATDIEHIGGPVENDDYWQAMEATVLTERGSYARKLNITPPERYNFGGSPFPDNFVYWLPYYILVESDQATSSETVKGALIAPSLI